MKLDRRGGRAKFEGKRMFGAKQLRTVSPFFWGGLLCIQYGGFWEQYIQVCQGRGSKYCMYVLYLHCFYFFFFFSPCQDKQDDY